MQQQQAKEMSGKGAAALTRAVEWAAVRGSAKAVTELAAKC
jgi:hypothetical protein